LPKNKPTPIESVLQQALSEQAINDLGRQAGQSKRLRVVTPFRMVLAIIAALAGRRVESLADLLREFNHQNDMQVAYKPFYNRLARKGFAEFMRRMLERLLGELALRILEPAPGSSLEGVRDVVIQDGSSFAVKHTLAKVFSGRFTKVEPAAVELHVTYSGFQDEVVRVILAPDKEAERQYLPPPDQLKGTLLLTDRGYPSIRLFAQLGQNPAWVLSRLSRSFDPLVLSCWSKGKCFPLRKPMRLSRWLSQQPKVAMDLDVRFYQGQRAVDLRLALFPGNEKHMTRLCTNLDRKRFPLSLVGKLYRFRWQVELVFKEWKSYANLHRFNTSNEYIVEGMIWAALCAAVLKRFLAHAAQRIGEGTAISTRRVAMCTHIIEDIFAALLHAPENLVAVIRRALVYLLTNARRAHPKRDRLNGRQASGLILIGAVA
jgi:hypothetical protein